MGAKAIPRRPQSSFPAGDRPTAGRNLAPEEKSRLLIRTLGPFGYDEFFVCKRNVDYRKNNRNKKRQSVNDHLGKNDGHACPMIYAIDPVVMMWKKGDRLLMPVEWKGRHRENWTATDMDIDV